MLSSSSKMRNAFCLAFCAALCFTLPLASKADTNGLTQAQIQSAFVAALKEYAEYSTGEDYLLPTLPFSDEGSAQYLVQYLIARNTGNISPAQSGIGYVFLEHMQALFPMIRGILAANTNIASRLNPGHNNREAIQVEDEYLLRTSLQNLDAVNAIYGLLAMASSPNGGFKLDLDDLGTNGVDVSDAITHDKLDNIIGLVDELLSKKPYDIELMVSLVEGNQTIVNHLGDIEQILLNSNGKLTDYKQYLEALVGHTHDLESADQASDSTYNSAYETAESDNESQNQAASSDYESIPFPEVSDDGYEPDISGMPEEPEDMEDLGLGNQEVGDHNALIRLYTPSSNRDSNPDDPPPMPGVEIDWGRDQVLQAQATKFSTFFAWFYRVLGTAFLSAKALTMFRKCKLATQARVLSPSGSFDPFVTLSWDPF